jgi:ketosteroid isomerase-like protein
VLLRITAIPRPRDRGCNISSGHFDRAWPSLPPSLLTTNFMKRLICFTIIASFAVIAVSFAAPDKATMEAKEKAAWQSFKDKNAGDFQKVVDKDIRCVYDKGISNMQSELDDMKKWDIKSFEITDYNIFSDEKDVVVATYKVKVEGTYDGKDMSGNYNAGSVWKKEGKDWLAVFHTNIKQSAAQ